ncbi:PREDICTED: A disintegrin and metalloproteinase with thrombospondin motifs 7 [Thamnophis sirtalis]|uniref:A disintegrin and metalloproteinase with thrombospondin motifs 7 n=1 Tax=Thamnophis sirtalis TaxID=35019 RepID=A0A6I9Y2D2_9SAUR|nr:PREDICTED: A disintegrin and metalloproteinase with thrombospondin motifs 7 [Thamnophis sirtalis]
MARSLLVLAAALLLARGARAESPGSTQGPDPGYEDQEVVYPVRVDERGAFLSYNLTHRLLSKRAIFSRTRTGTFYALFHRGQQLRFNLSLNPHLLAPGFVTEKRHGGISRARIRASGRNPCHMIGSVQNQEQGSGMAALSTCDGLKGVFHLAGQDFLIEPLAPSNLREGAAQPHRISRRHIWEYEAEEFISVLSTKITRKQPTSVRMCGVQGNAEGSEKWREHWEEKQQRKRRIKPRSVSKEKWVETLVVADTKMVEYHGSEHVEKYVLTVMNMVAGLFHDASIGNPVHISIVRLIFLENEEEDLKISHHADNTLRSFCKWQKALNPKGDAHPLHHDVAILLTRKDLCTAMNRPCETLGLAHVSGMCQPHRSCNVNEDTGLPLAFTVAHELGHSFGIQHDGSGNDCEPVGKRPFIMSPQLLYDTSPLTWSLCSREYITRFLDRGWGLCLDDPPAKDVIDFPSVPPGVLYDVSHQCRLQYGAYSTYCDDMDSVCNTLWCSVGNTCHSKLDAAVDGTKCDENKWCFNGECVNVGYRPEPVHGGWAAWSSWTVCSRTCGAGVQNAERPCNNPAPKYGGKYCLGERKRFRVCNAQPCPADKPSFRQIQCSRFDHRPYKGKLYKWSPVPNTSNPCELHCRPNNEYFAEKLRDAAIDGTPCYEGNSRRDRCINGICKNIGCDYEIDSYAMEDRCGVCHGDGSTCRTVKKTFEESEGLGYVDVGLIPAGAREIQIEEVAEAENFLALRSEDPTKYFLNGGWTIQWNGDYKVAGTTFTYKRMGNWENLTSPGPTEEPIWIQLLFQEKNPGVRYQYTIQQESRNQSLVAPPEFFWHYGPWTKCTATCGTGVQRQMVRCLEKAAGFVEEQYCDALSRPDDEQRNCNQEPCPARWWAGEWQACSATCGDSGLMKRTVLCIQSVALDEQQALPPNMCQHLTKPETTAACNREVLCLALWVTGNWSKCSVTCGKGTQRRPVFCPTDTRAKCDPAERPASERDCWASACWNRMENSVPDWSGSGSSSQELFNEIDFIPNYQAPKFSPSAPKSQNVITEEILLPNNHKKGNVFVDDFYYDYNFINFHEDLAYELVEEKNSKREDLKPNFGFKIFHTMEADPQEALPDLPPTTDLEVKLANRGSTSPTVGQENEKEHANVQDSSATDTLQDPFITPVVTSSSALVHRESFQPSLPEVHPSTSTVKSPPLGSSNHVFAIQEPPFINTFLKDNTARPDSSISSPSLDVLTPTMSSVEDSYGRNAFGTLSSTEDPGGRMQGPKIPELGNSSDHGLWEMVEETSRKQSNRDRVIVSGEGNMDMAYTVKENLANTFATTTGASYPLAHYFSASAGASWAFTVPDAEISSISGRDRLKNTPLLITELPSGTSPSTSAYQSSGPSRKTQMLHHPDTLIPLIATESNSLDRNSPFPNFSPSALLPSKQKQSNRIETDLETKSVPSIKDLEFSRDRNERPPPHVPTASSRGGAGREVKFQEPEGKMASSATPPDAVRAALNASWEAGNWSECSTTCGLGAVWRVVHCSTGNEKDCDLTRKPAPARRCYLRPCSKWHVGKWSKCSRTCGGGVKVRGIQCIDTRGQRSLRPFHCQTASYKPPAQMPCHTKPCLSWYTSTWRECSELCGGGEQERLVTCPGTGRCDSALQPNSTRPCNTQPCAKWRVGSWGQCTATCGEGVQRRQVKCLNTKTGQAEEDSSLCEHEPWPQNTQRCNSQDCPANEESFICDGDRLSFGFCQTLLWLGRCHLPAVRVQCCQTCHPHGLLHRDRGDERSSRK